MKISNIKAIKNIAWLILFLLITSIAIMILCQFILHKLYYSAGLVLIVVLLIVLLFRIRFTEIDDSGGCFSIRKSHPFTKKGYVSPQIEFPKSSICYFKISDNILSKQIKIIVHSQTTKKSFLLNLFLFTRKQINHIEMLLQEMQRD